MIETPKDNIKQPKTKLIPLLDWKKGVISGSPADRTPFDALNSSNNVVLGQDGTVTPRAGLKEFVVQPTNPVIGGPYEFVKVVSTVAEAWLIWAEDDSGTGKIYINNGSGGANTLVTGKTYDDEARVHFEQVADVVMITNGVDNLSYMSLSSSTITPYVDLDAPVITSVTETAALTGTTQTYYYQVTASNQGETEGSTIASTTVDKDHTQWDGSTENVAVLFPRVTNAEKYHIYRGTEDGKTYFLQTIVDPGSGTDVTYTDTGALYSNPNRPVPTDDSSAGPIVTRVTNIRGQPYMVGDTAAGNEGRIYYGGTSYDTALDFSPIGDGGWVEPNRGGKDFPVKVVPFRDGQGNPMPVCLSKSTNGTGKRYLIQYKTTDWDGTVLTYVTVQEDNGRDGTDSPDAVVSVNDSLFYPSREAFKTSKTKANVQNIISTEGITGNVSDKVANLSSLAMDKAVGLANGEIIYFSLPYISDTNNQMWVLDLRHKGAWMMPFNLDVDWMLLYSDNDAGITKQLMVVDDTFYEYDADTLTMDDGVAFPTSATSGHIKFSEDGMIWASVIDVTFVFAKSLGKIDLQVTMHSEDGILSKGGQIDTTDTESISGWGLSGWSMVGWGNIENQMPTEVRATSSRATHAINVEEEIDWISWNISTIGSGVSYELSGVIIRYVPIGFIEVDN